MSGRLFQNKWPLISIITLTRNLSRRGVEEADAILSAHKTNFSPDNKKPSESPLQDLYRIMGMRFLEVSLWCLRQTGTKIYLLESAALGRNNNFAFFGPLFLSS